MMSTRLRLSWAPGESPGPTSTSLIYVGEEGQREIPTVFAVCAKSLQLKSCSPPGDLPNQRLNPVFCSDGFFYKTKSLIKKKYMNTAMLS